MKRKFTLLIAALALLTMIVQPGRAWGQESYSITYDVTAIGNMFASGSSYESASGYWKVPASAGNSAQINIPITYQPDSDITITFRIATFGSGTNPSASNTTITAIGTETNSNWSGTGVSSYPSSSTYVNGVMTISKPQDPTTLGGLAITMGVNSGIKIFRLQSIAVEYTYSTGGGDLEDNDLTLSPTSLALDIHNNPNTGTVTYTTSSTGAVTVSQSEYVTTSVSGNTITVTPVAVTPSEQTITVSQAADATYAAGSATFTVNVTNSAPTVTVTYHANGGTGDNIVATPYQGSDYTVANNTFTKSGYAFTKWHTNAAGTGGTDYDPGDVIENISDNIDLYAQWEVSYETVDVLDLEFTGRPSSTNYGDWSDKEGTSGAVYAGNSAGDKNSIQLRTNNSNSGIITTTSAGNVTKVVVSWHGDTNNQRVLNVYGKNTPYESASDLYNLGTQGELLGTIAKSNQTTLEIDGSYAYIGLRSADGAMYLLEVSITWETGGTPAPSFTITNNDELAYDATNGSFNFTVNNPVEGGETTVTEEVDWISEATVTEGSVTFNTTTNPNKAPREGIVTLTYTYEGGDPVVKNVTITQAGNPSVIDPISSINSVGTFYRVQGTVVALNARGCVIGDGTGYINFYNGYTAPSVTVGAYVTATGNMASYGNIYQFSNNSPSTATIASAETSNYDGNPAITIIDEIPDTYLSGTHLSDYFQFDGTLTKNNGYYYVAVGEGQINIAYPSQTQQNTMNALENETVRVKGYFAGINSSNYFTVMIESIEEIVEPSIAITPAAINEVPCYGGGGLLEVTYTNMGDNPNPSVIECDSEGEPTDYDWLTAVFENENANIRGTITANNGNTNRTAYLKVCGTAANSENVCSNIVPITQLAYPTITTATLPFAFDGNADELANTAGLAQAGLGSSYGDSPKLKFKETGSFVILHFDETPGILTYDIQGDEFNGTFKVQTSADNVTYTDLKVYTSSNLTSTKLNESFDDLASTVRYIKWVYTEATSGKVRLGNIGLTGHTPAIIPATYAINVDAGEHTDELAVTYQWVEEDMAEVVLCDAEGNETTYDWFTAEVDGTDYNVTYIIGANETPDERKAYFMVYSIDENADYVYSEIVTVTQAGAVTPPTGDNYELYSGTLVEGDYIIYYEGSAMKNTVSNSRLSYETVTPNSNDVITTDNVTIVWHLAQSGDYWTIYSADANAYAASTGVKNKAQMLEDGTDDKALWTVSGTSTYDFVNKANAAAEVNAYLRNNVNNNENYGFACYASGTGGALSLFKKVDNSPSISADNVNIAYDAEEGEIVYTINNPVEGGILTANTEADWLMLDNVDETVPFLCDANTATTSRTATVTLTYTYENSKASVTKYVTVTQAAAPAPTYTVMFELDGGTFVPNNYFDDEIVEIEAGTYNLPSATKDGFIFAGWNDGDSTYEADASYTVSGDVTFTAQWTAGVTYTLVETDDDIEPGLHYIIVGIGANSKYFAMGSQANNYRNHVEVTPNGTTIAQTDGVYEFVISGDGTHNWTIYDENTPGYLYAAGINNGENYLKTQETNNNRGIWTIVIDAESHTAAIQSITTETDRNILRYNSNSTRFSCYNGSQKDIYLYKKNNDNDPVYYSPTEIAVADPDPTSEPIIVVNNEILVLSGDLSNCNNPGNLIIEDGGQLVFSGTGVQATMKKSTAHAGAKDVATDWYTIASPLAADVATDAVGNLTTGTYDLYRYNEATVMWENAKDTEHSGGFNELTVGRGYLYWNGSGSDITFAGELRNADVDYTLKADGTGNLKGFNLIGNPFSQNITMSNITGVTLSGGYVLTQAGGWGASIDEIAPCQGFLVQVEAETNIKITKPTSSGKSRANRDYLAFTVANSEYEDVAYAMFEEATGLSKINHRNADIPMVYIPQNGQNYAIATMDDNTQAFELNFKAMTTGQYTLSYKAEGKYSYLHVIDRLTGEDIDMLLDGEYSFIGSPRDNEARFIVKLSYNANIDEIEVNDNFAYQNGSDIIVNGNGELQVFDVTGRMVMNTKINGIQTVNVPATGMYIFRMVGESVQTQKIVVR